MKIALLCSGLGRIRRGHEAFARDLFNLLADDLDIVLFKGDGAPCPRERVIDHIPRDSVHLDGMHLPASPKWLSAAREVERMRVEGQTFAYAALKPLLEGDFDVIHCLEREVCDVIYAHRHLFRRTPNILWSNGGAIPRPEQPHCDYVQEHSEFNLAHSNRRKAFVIPHGVDLTRFHPGTPSDFRRRHGIPEDAFVVISVGTICYWHKRMDYVIREVSRVPGAWLIIVGQESVDSAAIRALGHQLLGQRIIFATLPHEDLPQAYAAANVFTLGSLFETFGIVYIEAMAMGLPVVCTNHPNQRSIVKEGIFVDMRRPGALAAALDRTAPARWAELSRCGLDVVREYYDLRRLKALYLERYQTIAATAGSLPKTSIRDRLIANTANALRATRRRLG